MFVFPVGKCNHLWISGSQLGQVISAAGRTSCLIREPGSSIVVSDYIYPNNDDDDDDDDVDSDVVGDVDVEKGVGRGDKR